MTTFKTSREICAPVAQVYQAISQPERLARWWGPAGFTNTFNLCDFKNGGRWSFTMHGPDGKQYANENVFIDIIPMRCIKIQHASEPRFCLTISLTVSPVGTLVDWLQVFENGEIARKIEQIVVPANEQNLDRLTEEVMRQAV